MKSAITARIKEYATPPVRDALVMGREAPIGCQGMRRALSVLIKAPYAHIETDDEVISDILIRESLLRRVSESQLIEFVLTHIKPLMSIEEVLHLELDIEVELNHTTI